MARSSKIRSANWVESSLLEKWEETMEAEERTSLLEKMIKHELSTGDVVKEAKKLRRTRRVTKEDDTEIFLMKKKLVDSKKEEQKFRKERNTLRKELETIIGNNNKFQRRVRRLKLLMTKKRTKIRKKNKTRIERDINKKNIVKRAKMLSSLPEECQEYGDLRIFRNTEIVPEPPNPPMVASKEITLSKAEIKILSKSPKFALRNILSKENYMAEIEKGLIKDKYGRIGKEEVDGKVVEEERGDLQQLAPA